MSLFSKEKILSLWKAASKNTFLTIGAPIFVLVLGGAVYLKQFTSLRYEYSKVTKNIKPEDIEELNQLKKPGEVTLESEYEKLKEMDIDNWKNIRGPRPWETPEETQPNR